MSPCTCKPAVLECASSRTDPDGVRRALDLPVAESLVLSPYLVSACAPSVCRSRMRMARKLGLGLLATLAATVASGAQDFEYVEVSERERPLKCQSAVAHASGALVGTSRLWEPSGKGVAVQGEGRGVGSVGRPFAKTSILAMGMHSARDFSLAWLMRVVRSSGRASRPRGSEATTSLTASLLSPSPSPLPLF